MIDMHCHILPEIDDGSESAEMSVEMLRAEAADKVSAVILTPHFNCSHESVDDFLRERDESLRLLGEKLTPGLPELLTGAEVRAMPGLADEEGIERLTLGDTRCILIEFPSDGFISWSNALILELQMKGLSPIIAHAERCIPFMRDEATLKKLIDSGAQAQISCETLIHPGFFNRGRIKKMLQSGLFGFIGSDAHNLTTRPVNVAAGVVALEKLAGHDASSRLLRNQERTLRDRLL